MYFLLSNYQFYIKIHHLCKINVSLCSILNNYFASVQILQKEIMVASFEHQDVILIFISFQSRILHCYEAIKISSEKL